MDHGLEATHDLPNPHLHVNDQAPDHINVCSGASVTHPQAIHFFLSSAAAVWPDRLEQLSDLEVMYMHSETVSGNFEVWAKQIGVSTS